MIRGHWKWDKETKTLVELCTKPKEAAPKVYIQTDEIPPTESMATADRKFFTSKRKLYDYDSDHGYEHTGGDHLTGKAPTRDVEKEKEKIRDDVARVENDLKWGNIPLTELEKEKCLREERTWKEFRGKQQ